MFQRYFFAIFVALVFMTADSWSLSNTNGTPIGGMGTGYVAYNAVTGSFGASGKKPPAGADGVETACSSSGFYFYANGKSVQKAKTSNEDAKCPVYTADFGDTGGVNFTLTAFGPYNPGVGAENYKLATSPLAFFEITATNKNSEEVDVAVAMEFANGGLLGGANTGTVQTGNQAISFTGSSDNAYLIDSCDGASPAYSAGAIGTFLTNGQLSDAAGNLVAAKCSVAAGASVHFRFTLAWWRTYESSVDRYSSGSVDKENYWYHNNFSTSQAVAVYGQSKFDVVKTGITSFVNRVLASNFPDWYNDRLLNNTYPLIHNSQCAKDGRLAFWEGKYGIIGTIDQGEHASLFYTFNWPEVQWHELQYWKRTAHKEDSCKGQIHHDFNTGVSSFSSSDASARFMCPWDNTLRNDYWWFSNTRTWADLNCMFIFKAYELMLATGNLDSMKTYFPQIKQTADRIIQQCGSSYKIPLNCHSTYDESTDGGQTFNTSPEYNGGVALTTYLAVIEIAKFVGQDSVATRFQEYYNTGRTQYRTQFVSSSSYATGKDCSEGDVAGYSWAHYFGFPAIMDSDFVTNAHKKLWSYYSTRTVSGATDLRAKLGKWGFYTCDHWGGVEIAIGKPDTALLIHNWDWQYYYELSPTLVFWQTLRYESSEKSDHASYMTAPTVWRSYFQMLGYLIDNANNRLWIRPSIPSSMNKKITSALLLNPGAMGTLDYDENASGTQYQSIHVAFDSSVTIKEFVLKNNTTVTQPGVSVKLNGVSIADTVSTEGSGYEKNIRVKLSSPIQVGSAGVDIKVYNGAVPVGKGYSYAKEYWLSIGNSKLSPSCPLRYTTDVAGDVTLDVIAINGARIGTLFKGFAQAGNHTLVWRETFAGGAKAFSGKAVLRLKSESGVVSKLVYISK
jgi:hypothetical protein